MTRRWEGALGARLGVRGLAGKRWGAQVGARGAGAGGRQAQACRRAHACWASGRRHGRQARRQAWARGARDVGARGARPRRACAHGGHAGWVNWASLGFGEPGSVLTQFFFTRF